MRGTYYIVGMLDVFVERATLRMELCASHVHRILAVQRVWD